MIYLLVFAVEVCGLILADQIATAALMDAVSESVITMLESITQREEESHEDASHIITVITPERRSLANLHGKPCKLCGSDQAGRVRCSI